MSDAIIALVSAIGGGLITAISSYAKNKSDVEKAQVETNASTEAVYVQNIKFIIDGYKDQVSEIKSELTLLKDEFERFKSQHRKEVDEYRDQISFLKLQIESKDERIEELEEIVTTKDIEIAFLKGEVEK